VIGNTGDNATPYADAVELDSLLADSVLLTYDGSGHTITFFDECVDAIVVDYFVDLVAPPAGTRCGGLPARLGVFLDEGDGGVSVLDVASGTAADAAGIAVGDLITSVDGRPTPTLADFPELTGGVPVTLTVNRAGAAIEIVATPTATATGWDVPVTE
jgi:C-terminal processing protease CtpA/Prc